MATTAAVAFPTSQDFIGWVAANKEDLKPPVGNKLMYGAGQMKVMVVGGPNARNDFHIEEGEEMFYMVHGDMRLDVIEKGVLKPVHIKQGEVFMLPARMPHSPQRFPDSVGLVMERERKPKEMDAMRWYADEERTVILHEEWFHCTDLGKDLIPVIAAYKATEASKTGKPTREFKDQPFEIDTTTEIVPPQRLDAFIASNAGKNVVLFEGEFRVAIMQAPEVWPCWSACEGETFLWQITGGVSVDFKNGDETSSTDVPEGHVLVVPAGLHFKVNRTAGTVGMVITNKVVASPANFATIAAAVTLATGAGAGAGAAE